MYCKFDNAAERKESYRKFVLYGAGLVNVWFRDKESGEFKGRSFSYIADVPLQYGDIVLAPTRFGLKEAFVCQVDVPINGIQCRIGELRHITEAATPGGDVFKGFFD